MIFGGWFLFLLENFGRKADGERKRRSNFECLKLGCYTAIFEDGEAEAS